ncbi:hypothetical protein [Comamonas composti]|uniref:hypothetical protein n=1 Tax=Comamonas composti TaxID=408558 RepID=UPI0012EBD87C|nr:hypothetical protein [Comamonas composti]
MSLEGGGKGGSSAPAPDPRLVEAQIKSMGIQDNAIQKILAQSDDMAPLQKEQTQFALDTSKKAWQQSQDDRDYALGRRMALTGLQDRMIDDARTFDTEGKREELAGQAAADVSQAYESSKRTQAAEMARMGINPADGKYGAASNALAAGTALATAQGKNSARTAARAEGRALTDRASNALAGFPAMGMQATGQGAGFGTNAQMIANQGLAGLNSGYGQVGGMAGQMGSNATNMWGAQASYKNGQDQIAANNNPFNTLLGAAGGVGTAFALNGFKFAD